MHKARVVQLASMFGLVLIAVAVCTVTLESDATGNTVVIDEITYSLTESGGGDYATVVAVNNSLTTVDIPSSISVSEKEYEVRFIELNVFYNNTTVSEITIHANNHFQLKPNQFSGCSALRNISFGEGITEISDNAFFGCTSLEVVTLPTTTLLIGNSSFSGCSKLATINLNVGIKTIGESAFKGCTSLATLNLGDALEGINVNAFQGCTSLTDVTLPNALLTLGGSAFENCSNLCNVTLGNNLNAIGSKAFAGTKITELIIPAKTTSLGLSMSTYLDTPFPSTMTSLTIDENNPKYACENNIILDKETNTLVFAFNVAGEVTLSNNVGPNAFYGRSISKLIITEGVTSIGAAAFSGCTSLNKLTLADGLGVIGGFYGCTGLNSLSLPNTIEVIDDAAFKGCTALVTTLPSNLKVIGNEAFRDCSALPCPVLPVSLTRIGSYAFYNATNVTFSNLTLGENTEINLGEYAINLNGSTGTALILNKVTCDDEYAYGKIFYNATTCAVALGDDFKLWKWQNGLGISLDGKTVYMKEPGNYGDVIIPASVERIIGTGFQSYTNNEIPWKLTCEDPNSTITLDSGVTSKTTCGVFFKSQYLTSVSLPNVVVNEGRTFYNCKNLESLSVTSISSLPPNTIDNTKLTELHLNGCEYIVGPISSYSTSKLVLIEIPESLKRANMSTPGFTFYDVSGKTISFKQGSNALSETVQADKLAGKLFYSPSHNKKFYEVSENEIILITEKESGNTFQKIAKGDIYSGIVGSGQVYKIVDGKVLLSLHVEDELHYVAIDKGSLFGVDSPTKSGYSFVGWFSDSGCTMSFDTSVAINADQVLYAKFVINQYTITFDTAGGSDVAAITQDYDSDVVAPADPTKIGYTFAGWSAEIPAKMPVDGMTITASWDINQYSITFDTAGGSDVAAITQDYGSTITAPTNVPSKEGYLFVKWDSEIPATMPAENVAIKAVWAVVATVNENGKSVVTLDAVTDSFIPAAETKEITVEIRENTAVKVENASDLIGKTVVSKVESVSNNTGLSGTAYEFTFTADGDQYNGKMQVTLPYVKETGKKPVVYYWNGSESTKMNVVSSTETSVTFETDHNSTYVVASETPDSSGSEFILYFGLMMVIGIAIAMLVGFNFYRKKA